MPLKEDVVDDIAFEMENFIKIAKDDKTFGMITFATKALHNGQMHTYAGVTGMMHILADGLYSELASQLETGETSFYSILRNVLSDIEKDLKINPEDFARDIKRSNLH